MFRGFIVLIAVLSLGSGLGGFVFLRLGFLLSRIAFLSITPFEGAIVCVGWLMNEFTRFG